MYRVYSSVDEGETAVQNYGFAADMTEANIIAHEAYLDGECWTNLFVQSPDGTISSMIFNLGTANNIEYAKAG